jgi:SAM-dependent methyltransferase
LTSANSGPIITWLPEEALDGIATSSYWNDCAIEKEKEWYIEDLADYKVIRYVREETNLEEAFLAGISFLEEWLGRELRGVCLDLGAGVCWTSALLANKSQIERVFAVEISRHRLLSIAPLIFRQYQAPAKKVIRVLGDFAEIKLEDNSVDVVVMCQAFHHASQVEKLVKEVARVLTPGGGIIVTGERPLSWKQFLHSILKHNIKSMVFALRLEKYLRPLWRGFSRPPKLFGLDLESVCPHDPLTGDHFYTPKMVERIFRQGGLSLRFQALQKVTGKTSVASCNYIARKL